MRPGGAHPESGASGCGAGAEGAGHRSGDIGEKAGAVSCGGEDRAPGSSRGGGPPRFLRFARERWRWSPTGSDEARPERLLERERGRENDGRWEGVSDDLDAVEERMDHMADPAQERQREQGAEHEPTDPPRIRNILSRTLFRPDALATVRCRVPFLVALRLGSPDGFASGPLPPAARRTRTGPAWLARRAPRALPVDCPPPVPEGRRHRLRTSHSLVPVSIRSARSTTRSADSGSGGPAGRLHSIARLLDG